MSASVHFRGLVCDRLRSAEQLTQSILEVSARRLLKGPQRPGWNWFVEVATQMLRKQVTTAFALNDMKLARLYLDSVVISSPLTRAVNITAVEQAKFRGQWFIPRDTKTAVTLLYFHGGGYSFYPQAYSYFISLITLAAKSGTFALDYRLAPEHRFPAQLEDALNAYRWFLENGTDPDQMVLAGDSAGGNLALALLLAVREAKLPLPVLAIALSPPTAIPVEPIRNADLDWIDQRMLTQWADWFCDPAQRRDPLVSPLYADLRGLPPIYMQAGRAEILYDSIQAFAEHGRNQGADVVLESWPDMNHVFQMFGFDAPQSTEALKRIGEVMDFRVRRSQKEEIFPLCNSVVDSS
jgi:epsilon-lactone hydrolase